MRLLLLCVGRLKAGPERELVKRYLDRAGAAARSVGLTAVELREIDESRARRAAERKAQEAQAIRSMLAPATEAIAFDERGKSMSSRDFALFLAGRRDQGLASAALVIGGPDGLDPAFCASAKLVLSFGAMTFPHQLARIMAAEQIYRAATILAGHPYHRD